MTDTTNGATSEAKILSYDLALVYAKQYMADALVHANETYRSYTVVQRIEIAKGIASTAAVLNGAILTDILGTECREALKDIAEELRSIKGRR